MLLYNNNKQISFILNQLQMQNQNECFFFDFITYIFFPYKLRQ